LTFTRVGCLLQDLGRFVYIAFVVDVFAQRIVGWHAATTKVTDVVLTPLRIALWDRDRQRDPGQPGQLLHHSDAGSQYTSIRFTSTSSWRASLPRSAPWAIPS
jgi:transposase InsO family protein